MNSDKPMAQLPQRDIHLTPAGREVVASFVNLVEPLPAYATMNENIKRWGDIANIDTQGLCVKSFRKTWESFLTFYYPEKQTLICMSQGHSSITAVKHYLNMRFDERDKLEMRSLVEGWE